MLADLEGALEVEVARAGGATGEATTVLDSVPAAPRPARLADGLDRRDPAGPRRRPAAGAGRIAALTGDERRRRPPRAPAAQAGDGDRDRAGDGLRPRGRRRASTPRRPAWRSTATPRAPRGRPRRTRLARAWPPRQGGRGLIVDAGEPVAGRRLTSQRTTRAGAARSTGRPKARPRTSPAGASRSGRSPTREERRPSRSTRRARYYLVWITTLAENPDGGFFATISRRRAWYLSPR